ncbi:hypothetical protein [Paenibacillus medicaginis]|uniref:Copper amine oxidase-like N-terminal domain-containing protein n=1 Tax=Paenibacillus medicaginis TaxID=1470560 RepID=A0ABV5C6L0_9BACL
MMLIQLMMLAALLSPFSGADAVQTAAPPPAADKAVHAVATVPKHSSMSRFITLNGISLDDREEDVLHKKGKPLQVTKDWLLRSTEYHYADAVVGIRYGYVDYVHVDPEVKRVKINDRWLPLNRGTLAQELGRVQFAAEDGDVYIRGHKAIKVYTDPVSGELQAVEFFAENSQ